MAHLMHRLCALEVLVFEITGLPEADAEIIVSRIPTVVLGAHGTWLRHRRQLRLLQPEPPQERLQGEDRTLTLRVETSQAHPSMSRKHLLKFRAQPTK